MMTDLRDAIFLRMVELMQGGAPFLWDEGERKRFNEAWNEIMPLALHTAKIIKEEQEQ